MTTNTHYPNYDVWDQNAEWDPHTRKIVGKRRTAKLAHQFFSYEEGLLLQSIVELLVDDHRLEVLSFIMEHLDQSLAYPVGEGQRKAGLPPKPQLIRKGLSGLEEASLATYGLGFLGLHKGQQEELLAAIEAGTAARSMAWSVAPQKDFFKELLHDIVSAYYSHPLVWSDIGYGGPAYPRGYVRVEKGLTDPWEAKRDGK